VRIGVLHGQYRSHIPSGENKTVEDIVRTLNQAHTVTRWSSNPDQLVTSARLRLRRAIEIMRCDSASTTFKEWLGNQDTLLIHNYFSAVSLENLDAIAKSGKSITRVVHNYRKTCLTGNHFRKNKECFKCSGGSYFSGIIRGCYNSSKIMSSYMSIYSRAIEKFESEIKMDYIAISPLIREYLIECGINKDKITVIPNSTPRENPISEHATDCIFVGRIEDEKGIFKLIDVWRNHSELPMLHIVGGGTRVKQLQNAITNLKNVYFHGLRYGDELASINHNSKVAIFPALWKEPFGRVVVEAMSRGQALACSKNLTQLDAIDEKSNGQYFDLTDNDMFEKISKCLMFDSKQQIRISTDKWLANYSPSSVANRWLEYFNNLEMS